jgi:hypothetical protein
MPQDLSIRPTGGLSAAPPSERPRPAEIAPVLPVAPVAVPNPRLRIDGALGVLVIEFRDEAGEVAQSYPNPREIEAYRVQAMAVSSGDLPPPEGAAAKPVARAAI